MKIYRIFEGLIINLYNTTSPAVVIRLNSYAQVFLDKCFYQSVGERESERESVCVCVCPSSKLLKVFSCFHKNYSGTLC